MSSVEDAQTQEISNPPEISPAKREKMMKNRRSVAQELLETEKNYVENLEILKKVYYEPMHENSKDTESKRVISPDDVRMIFGSLNIIIPVNKLLLIELTKRLNVPEDQELIIGEAFLTLV